MDNAQKAIMIGVGLFITIIVIAAVMLITGIGQDLLNSGTNQLQGLSESLRVQVTDEYDDKTFTATQVRTACKDLAARYPNGEVSIVISPAISTGDDYDGYVKSIDDKDIPSNGTQKYKGDVTYNDKSGVPEVTFIKQVSTP